MHPISFSLISYGGLYGRAVNTSDAGSEGPGFKRLQSRCFLRLGTLLHFAAFHPGVKNMGTGDILLGGNTAMDQHTVQGE